MIPQEAIEKLGQFVDHEAYTTNFQNVCKTAILALKKQIPKRISENNRCPCCDTYNETIEKRKNTVKKDICYCWHCGQALDWSDKE